MKARTLSRRVALVLTALGLAGMALRWAIQRRAGTGEETLWRLTYHVEFEAEHPGAEIRVAVPGESPHVRVFREDIRAPRLRLDGNRRGPETPRQVVAVAQQAGEYHLLLRFDLHLTSRGETSPEPASRRPQRSRYLRAEPEVQCDAEVVAQLLQELEADSLSNEALAERLFRFCHERIAAGGPDSPADAAGALQKRRAQPLGKARALVALCRAAGLPARLATGFVIAEAGQPRPRVWVEVFTGEQWRVCDPLAGHWPAVPPNYLPVRRGSERLIWGTGLSELESQFTLTRLPGFPEELAVSGQSWLGVLDLTRLPLEMHHVISVLLLIPLGALVTCMFRNLIGLETSGRFSPMLVALSFVFADWRTGLLVFGAAMSLGLCTRSVVEYLKLLVLPRLSIILTLVVWCIVFGVSLLHYLQLTPAPHAVLLPMVILTMIIERFHVTAQEDGVEAALKRLAGTMVVGCVCYLVLRWETVAAFLLAYPEAHLLTLAALILLGRYTGYRLMELWRFREMALASEPTGEPRRR